MYEPQAEAREFTAADRAEAVEKACSFFDAEESELTIAELAVEDVFGLGGRVVVVAAPRQALARSESRRDREATRGREGPRERGRGRDRDRGEPRRGRPSKLEAEPPVSAPAPEGPSEANRKTELSTQGEFVCGILERMELGPFEIGESREDGLLALSIEGPAAVHLTGGDGRAVDAIQLLANQAGMRVDAEGPRIVLDVEGERAAREEYLERLADRAARRAISAERSIALDPMNSRDRRIIHVALRNAEDIATMSTGTGRYRQVVVVPRGAPEYEEALRYAEAAVRSDEE